jgi:hypothetical protein
MLVGAKIRTGDEESMSKVLPADRGTRAPKAKQQNVEDRPYPVPKQPIIADYLRGKIPHRRFVGMVGEKTFHAVWEKLAASIQEITQKAKQRLAKASIEDESANLAITGLANSFVLWNLPDSYGAGPLERVRVVDDSLWIFPLVLTSPGYGIVGEVGHVAVDIQRGEVVGCTPLDMVQQRGRKCYERHKEKIEAAFLQTRGA